MRRKTSEEKREGLLWDASKKYTKGEINAKELKNTLSSRSTESDYIKITKTARYILSIFSVIVTILCLVLYLALKNGQMLILSIMFSVYTLAVYKYYFDKKNKD